MRILTKILSVILMVTLCLSAIAAPASADLPKTGKGQVAIHCDTLNVDPDSPVCDFSLASKSKFCNAELWKREEAGVPPAPANALRWEFTVQNNQVTQDIFLHQTQEPLCDLREIRKIPTRDPDIPEQQDPTLLTENKIPPDGQEYRVKYVCNRGAIRYLANYISGTRRGIPSNFDVQFTNLFCSEILVD